MGGRSQVLTCSVGDQEPPRLLAARQEALIKVAEMLALHR